ASEDKISDVHLTLVVGVLNEIEGRLRWYACALAPAQPGKINLRLAKIGRNVALTAILHAEINRHRTRKDGVQPRKDRITGLVIDIQPDLLLALDRPGAVHRLDQGD